MKNWINNIKAQIPEREEGQGVVEYAVVLGVIVVAVVGFFNATPIQELLNDLIAEVAALA